MRMNFRRERFDSVEQHREPRTVDLATRVVAIEHEARKRAAFQTLVEKPESVSIEKENLEPIATLVGEHEEMS